MIIITLMMLVLIGLLMLGVPVAFVLSGVSVLFAVGGILTGHFDLSLLNAISNRLYGILIDDTFLSVPLFIFMGLMLERSEISKNLVSSLADIFRNVPNSLALVVIIIGTLLAASTAIIGATIVTLGLLALPQMLKQGYPHDLATGSIMASGTLGQIIPPSIVLIMLADTMSNAFQQAQLSKGIFSPESVTVADLFAGALIPGLLLALLYCVYILLHGYFSKNAVIYRKNDALEETQAFASRLFTALKAIIPPLALILLVMGSILAGVATVTEAAALGASAATLLSFAYRKFSYSLLNEVMRNTLVITSMIYLIVLSASIFSLVFRGYGGDDIIKSWLINLPGGRLAALSLVMLIIFLLGFPLDIVEIIFVVVPIVGPVLLAMDYNPIWLGVLIAVNLQTSYLTPPVGFALFFLRGVAPREVSTLSIYKGVIPFVSIQLLVLVLLAIFPALVTWLPHALT